MTNAQMITAKFLLVTGCAIEDVADSFGVSISKLKEFIS